MKLRHVDCKRRPAFSLIELLVVIAIIAVLISLIAAFIVPMLSRGPVLTARDELGQFDRAMGEFKGPAPTGFAVDVPPTQLKLCTKSSLYNLNNAQDVASLQYINRMFPSLGANWTVQWASGGTHWNLDPDQVLVFILGGLPNASPPGCLGFGSNPKNPADFTNGKKGPYVNFQTARLYQRVPGNPFYSYMDPFSTESPYLYFGHGAMPNNYSAVTFHHPLTNGTVAPYYQTGSTPPQYFNPNSMQVITAGPDGKFGPGGAWNSAAPAVTPVGVDDMTNFSAFQMGAAQGS